MNRLHMRWLLVHLLVGVLALAAQAQSSTVQALSAEARLSSNSVYAGETFQLQISVGGTASPEQPTLPEIPGMSVEFAGGQNISRQSVQIINGRRTEDSFLGYAFVYNLTAMKPGEYKIPAIDVRADGRSARTIPLTVRVQAPSVSDEVRLLIASARPSAYEGEPIELTATLLFRVNLSRASITIPGTEGGEAAFEVIAPPDVTAGSAAQNRITVGGVEVPFAVGNTELNGLGFTTATARVLLVPRKSGSLTIGPALAQTSVQSGRSDPFDIFERGRERRIVAPSNELPLEVKPLPSEGRPASFTGLIGVYSIETGASPVEVNVGDPIALTMSVRGPLPDLVRAPAIDRQAEVASSFRVTDEGTPSRTEAKQKTFERTLRALSAEVKEIPAIELPYFDTARGEYAVARSEPIPIRVRSARIVTAADAVGSAPAANGGGSASTTSLESAEEGISANAIGLDVLRPSPARISAIAASPVSVGVLAFPPAACALVGLVRASRRLLAGDGKSARKREAYQRARTALAGSGTSLPAAESGQVLGRFISQYFGNARQSFTAAECEKLLAPIDSALAARVRRVLDACDAARFGGLSGAASDSLAREAAGLVEELHAATRGRA